MRRPRLPRSNSFCENPCAVAIIFFNIVKGADLLAPVPWICYWANRSFTDFQSCAVPTRPSAHECLRQFDYSSDERVQLSFFLFNFLLNVRSSLHINSAMPTITVKCYFIKEKFLLNKKKVKFVHL